MTNPTVSRSTHVILRRAALMMTAFAMMALVGSCSKTEEEAPPIDVPLGLDGEPLTKSDIDTMARERYRQYRDVAEPFDRYSAELRLVQERYGMKLARLFPDGYQPQLLKSIRQIHKELDTLVDKVADEKYPPSDRVKMLADLEKKLALRKVGDDITIVVRPSGRQIDGVIDSIQHARIEINHTFFLFIDIASPDPVCFHDDKRKKRIKFLISTRYDYPRRDYHAKLRKGRYSRYLRQNAYVKIKGNWTRADELIKNVTPKVNELEDEYQTKLQHRLEIQVEQELRNEGYLPMPVQKDDN